MRKFVLMPVNGKVLATSLRQRFEASVDPVETLSREDHVLK